ncbi:type II toxin-antitoxin system RelE/ParE family toxin [Rhizobium sp. RU36D]|uniref:type II toxin-antitoxin system RelE/ParE family toxin n=1 Tax=Rhizobium sp. RU36D TaxID=1907415 RepID=UPI0009D837C9|nr:type II toxin-antitoxin system RelE/ParE family toxin [Rhizobium sp. RU36D]SMC62044.1 Plasmid stabilization system protein ParE [Rhizobium sp. RU36D]
MNVTVLPAARADILQQVEYYARLGRPDIADRFLAAVEASFVRLKETPRAGAPKMFSDPRLSAVRTWTIAGFDDIKAYYLVDNSSIAVLRILHGRRDVDRIFEAEEL